MIDLALSVLALVAGGFALELYSSTWASLGYRDKHGLAMGAEVYSHVDERPSERLG